VKKNISSETSFVFGNFYKKNILDKMKSVLALLATLVVLTVAEPPVPSFSSSLLGLDLSGAGLSSSGYNSPPPDSSYGAPTRSAQSGYGAPAQEPAPAP